MKIHKPVKGPLREVGFWVDFRSPLSALLNPRPDPRKLVVPGWLRKRKEDFAKYLDQGERVEQYMGFSYCRFNCGAQGTAMGTADLSDGAWVWPEGLSHYIREHDVVLPPEFVSHVFLKLAQ